MPENCNQEHCPHTEKAATAAVKKTFAILGVDVDIPLQVEDFRKSLRFSEQLRQAAERGILVFVTAICSGIVYTIWIGLKASVGKGV